MCLPCLGLSLQGESSCVTSASPLGCGNREEKDWRPTSGGSSPSTSPRAVRDRDTWTVQVGILTSAVTVCTLSVVNGSFVFVGAQWAQWTGGVVEGFAFSQSQTETPGSLVRRFCVNRELDST